MSELGAFFVRDGERLVATELTRGPWSAEHMHGGPPGALLCGALERAGAASTQGPGHVARVTLELLRPLPIGAYKVEARVAHAGKQVQRLEARLLHLGAPSGGSEGRAPTARNVEGAEVARAQAVRVRALELGALPATALGAPCPLPPPDEVAPTPFSFFPWPVGYHVAVDIRIARGRWAHGPVTAWARPLVPLVAGEPTSPLERVAIIVDAESGIGPPLDPAAWSFVNPDLTIALERPLEGEWVGLDVVSTAASGGVGLSQSALFDGRGVLGRSLQSLFVQPRTGPSPPRPAG